MTVLGIAHAQPDESNIEHLLDLQCAEVYEPLLWCNIQPRRDVWNWTDLDAQFELEKHYGIKSTRYITHTPNWASGVNPKNCKYPSNSYPPRSVSYTHLTLPTKRIV